MKIWYTTADLELDDSHMDKYENFKNSRWRTTAILKIVFDHILSADCPISVNFAWGNSYHRSSTMGQTDTGVP